jgi:hypothetical protein
LDAAQDEIGEIESFKRHNLLLFVILSAAMNPVGHPLPCSDENPLLDSSLRRE